VLKFVRQRDCSVGEIYELLVRCGGRITTTLELFECIREFVGTDVKEHGMDKNETYGVGLTAKWYVVELIYRMAMAWKGIGGVVGVGFILGWVSREWITWGQKFLK